MKEWTKSQQWYWFCEHKEPSGAPCKATLFNIETEKKINLLIAKHMAEKHDAN